MPKLNVTMISKSGNTPIDFDNMVKARELCNCYDNSISDIIRSLQNANKHYTMKKIAIQFTWKLEY